MTDQMQSLMSGAYDRWQEHDEWSQQDFWDQLDADERFAVFMGNLNYQVQNGGFSQWWGNKYATEETVGYILRTCVRMGTETSQLVHDLVAQAWKAIGGRDESDIDDEEWDDLEDQLINLDIAYYKLDEQFMVDCEAFLTKEVSRS